MIGSEAVLPFQMDERILGLRISGRSIREIARTFGVSAQEIEESLDRTLPKLDGNTRARMLREEVARCEELQSSMFELAKGGDTQAAAVMARLSERKASLCGLDAPRSTHATVLLHADTGPVSTVTDKIEAALARIRGETSVELVHDGTADPDAPAA